MPAAPRQALTKGWCPGALRPMAAKDGLLVRLRLTGGIVTAAHAEAIADLAERFGSGLLDLTSRGNLQMRGVTESSWPALIDNLQELTLVDDDAAAEAVRNVVASPLAGLHVDSSDGGIDIRPLVRALEGQLVADPELQRLPGKFGFLVDDGTQPSLASVSADVRFDWLPEAKLFSIGLGGTGGGALRIGSCRAEALVARARCAALGAIALLWERDAPRRLRGLIESLGGDTVAAACGGAPQEPIAASRNASKLVGTWRFGDHSVLGLATPFGRLDAAMLRRAARLAGKRAGGELRLTPWRTILLPDAAPETTDLAALRTCGFILDGDDPRLDVVACVGRDGCVRGTTPTHADAALLADLAADVARTTGAPLHVSGCEKGCARAEAAPITLVGRGGRYDLVRGGRSNDMPTARGLDLAGVRAAIMSCRAS